MPNAFPIDMIALIALVPAVFHTALITRTGGKMLVGALALALAAGLATAIPSQNMASLGAAADALAALLLLSGLITLGQPTRRTSGAATSVTRRFGRRLGPGLIAATTVAAAATIFLKSPAPALLAAALVLVFPLSLAGSLAGRAFRLPAAAWIAVCSLQAAVDAIAALSGPARALLQTASPVPGAIAVALSALLCGEVARLRQRAERDDLTGLCNRRAFLEQGETLIETSAARGKTLSVLLVDLDHFKTINDRFGHAGGDDALRHVADILVSGSEGHGTVGRLGGEEFGLLLKASGEDAGLAEADRLRNLIGESPVTLVAPDGRVEHVSLTASFGVAPILFSDDAAADLLAAIHDADMALYAAKGAGRNRAIASGRRQAGFASAARALHAAAAQMRAATSPPTAEGNIGQADRPSRRPADHSA